MNYTFIMMQSLYCYGNIFLISRRVKTRLSFLSSTTWTLDLIRKCFSVDLFTFIYLESDSTVCIRLLRNFEDSDKKLTLFLVCLAGLGSTFISTVQLCSSSSMNTFKRVLACPSITLRTPKERKLFPKERLGLSV